MLHLFILFKNLKAVDRGDGTFALAQFHDGTLRHLAKGNSRTLGSFEDDAMQKHIHNSPPHSHTANSHDHDMAHQHDYKAGNKHYEQSWSASGGFWSVVDFWGHTTTGGRNRTDSQTVTINNTTITLDEGTGKKAEETRMKNTAGQWYILAKVLI